MKARNAANEVMMSSESKQIATLKSQGANLMQGNRFDEAKALYTNITEISPEDAEAWYMLSTIHGKLGNVDEAEKCCRQVLALRPDHSEAYVNLGHVFYNRGNHAEAVKHYQQAIRLKPDSPKAYYNIGNIYNAQGKQEEAIENYRHAISLAPMFAEAHNNLGTVYLEQGKLDEAVPCYVKALEINPSFVVALNNLAKVCRSEEQFDRYVEFYRKAIDIIPDPVSARTVFSEKIKFISPDAFNPWLADELLKCFSISGIYAQPLALVAALHLKHKYSIRNQAEYGDAFIRDMLDRIAADELFVKFIEKTINIDGEMEIFLTRIRRALLFKYSQGSPVGDEELGLVAALALQCINNEYVFAVDEEEERQLAALKGKIEQRVPSIRLPNKDIEHALLVFGMYERLFSLSCREVLIGVPLAAWSGIFHRLAEEALINPFEEEKIKKEIVSIGNIEDETSQLVQSQYEENPYPRWLTLSEYQKVNLKKVLQHSFPNFSLPAFLDEPIQILVAGCGTGQHPIQIALTYDNVEILAVDITKSSLAYAIRMARKFGVKNIQFMQGDILELSKLNRRFHIIECMGVLHHMKDPLAGWKVLSSLLVENGLMAIGLYSEKARKHFTAAREVIKNERLTPDKKNIRYFRERILRREMGELLYGISKSADFYSMSGCRDLLFHFMEHRYTLPQLEKILNDLSLKFIGFSFDNEDSEALNSYRNHFPEDKEMTNLRLWDQFEDMYPYTFKKMYQFRCQKVGG